MTRVYLKRNSLKKYFRKRIAHANIKTMIDGKASWLGDKWKDLLSSAQGSAEAKSLTCVIALIHKSIWFFFSSPWQYGKESRSKNSKTECASERRWREGKRKNAQNAVSPLTIASLVSSLILHTSICRRVSARRGWCGEAPFSLFTSVNKH